MRSTFLCVAAALFGAGLAVDQRSPWTEASTAIRMDLDELVERSELVLEAHVVSASPVDIQGQVFTDYQLLVDRTWWGEDLGVRTVRLPGGVLPSGRGTMVPGMPSLVPGDDVVLALTEPDASERRVVVGLSQGRWRIVGDGQGGKLALRGGEGAALVSPNGGLALSADHLDIMDYADLIMRVEAAVGAKRARGGTGGGK
jgi:hypothetical protein